MEEFKPLISREIVKSLNTIVACLLITLCFISSLWANERSLSQRVPIAIAQEMPAAEVLTAASGCKSLCKKKFRQCLSKGNTSASCEKSLKRCTRGC